MTTTNSATNCFDNLFIQLTDPRDSSKVAYPLNEILFQSISAICSGAEGPSDIADFGEECIEWLRSYYPYTNGTASHDTINRTLALLPVQEFESLFISWVYEVFTPPEHMGQIAIDGKRIARSVKSKTQQLSKADGGSHAKVLVNAMSTKLNLTLAQIDVSDSLSEVAGANYLLDLLNLKGNCISADAGFLGRELIEKIREKGADYLITLKAKSPRYFEATAKSFEQADSGQSSLTMCRFEEEESKHGRNTKWAYECLKISELQDKLLSDFYPDATQLVRVKRWRSTANKSALSPSVHYYITSLTNEVNVLAKMIRGHWTIENKLHWTLDVVFNEDNIRSWQKNLAVNMAVLRKISLNLISDSARGKGVKRRRFRAMISEKSRHELLKNIMR